MLRNSLILFMLLGMKYSTMAQQKLQIGESELSLGRASVNVNGYHFAAGTNLYASGGIKAEENADLTAMGIPLGQIKFQPKWSNGQGEVNGLTVNYQVFAWYGGLSLLSWLNYDFSVEFSIAELNKFGWRAGLYPIKLDYESWGTTGLTKAGASVTPAINELIVEVPVIAKALTNVNPNFQLKVNDFSSFRNSTLSATYSNALMHTVDLGWKVQGVKDVFDFNNGYPGLAAPATSIGRVRVNMPVVQMPATTGNTLLDGAAIFAAVKQAVSPANQRLATSPVSLGSIPVGNGNLSGFSLSVNITPEDLRAGFINSGTYSTQLKLNTSIGSLGNTTQSIDLSIEVPDIQEINVLKKNVDLSFNSVNDYSNGISVDVPDQLQLSKTRPYDLSVRAESANFSSGTENFPVSVLGIGPASGQTGVNNITSLSTQNQILISGAAATVDRNISLRYTISATAANELITKKKDRYSNNLIFTLAEH